MVKNDDKSKKIDIEKKGIKKKIENSKKNSNHIKIKKKKSGKIRS